MVNQKIVKSPKWGDLRNGQENVTSVQKQKERGKTLLKIFIITRTTI